MKLRWHRQSKTRHLSLNNKWEINKDAYGWYVLNLQAREHNQVCREGIDSLDEAKLHAQEFQEDFEFRREHRQTLAKLKFLEELT